MATIFIVRLDCGDYGTFGRVFLLSERGPFCYSLEPPWRNNQRNLSCIPAGDYTAVWHRSPRYGWVYRVMNVPERSNILVHWGNYGGDRTKGLLTHTQGCILLGHRRGWLRKQRAILASRVTVRRFFNQCEQQRFIRVIVRNA